MPVAGHRLRRLLSPRLDWYRGLPCPLQLHRQSPCWIAQQWPPPPPLATSETEITTGSETRTAETVTGTVIGIETVTGTVTGTVPGRARAHVRGGGGKFFKILGY